MVKTMVKNPELTTISILKTTREKLSTQMKHNQTYDEFLNELLNKINELKQMEVK
jgi:hypothetical protein